MARVYSLHMIALKAGASAEEFERYFSEEFLTRPQVPGMTWRLLVRKGGPAQEKYNGIPVAFGSPAPIFSSEASSQLH